MNKNIPIKNFKNEVNSMETWSPYDNKQILGDNFFTGYMICPICGNKGELFEGIMVMSVDEDWTEEIPFVCPKCKDDTGTPLTIGFAGIKKGKRKEFFDDLIKSLNEPPNKINQNEKAK